MSSIDMLMMRHGYDDHSYIDGKNDTCLTKDGVRAAKIASIGISRTVAVEYGLSVDLRVSARRRAIQTADILVDELDRHKIDYSVFVDPNLRELYQGHMQGLENMTHEEKVRALELGWEIFDKQRKLGNDDYRFGTPDDSDPKFDSFNGFIAPPYGESQNDLSGRIENAFVDTLHSVLGRQKTPIVLAHRGTIRELLNIVAAHNNGTYDIKQNPEIEMAGWKYCELFKATISDIGFSLGALKRHIK